MRRWNRVSTIIANIMGRPRPICTGDCETDPFCHGRIPKPFIWGFYDGKEFKTFDTTEEFVEHVRHRRITIFMHNGGKFDFMYLLQFVGETKAQIINGRIVSMGLGDAELVDSFAGVPQALGSIKKDEIEYWKMETQHRNKYREEIISYLKGDCIYLYELMVAYRKNAGKKKTIASNALAHAKSLGINPGTTNHRFDANYRPFYFGGRTQCFRPGTHECISVFDIKSSYPRAMMEDHATGTELHWHNGFHNLTREEIQRSFIILKCYSHGAFPLRGAGSEGLNFPKAYNEYYVTGWEYIAAKDLGLIDDEKIISVRTTTDTINFRDYVDHWYKFKNDHSAKDKSGHRIDPINYTIGKFMMNSLYGKMAQNPESYHDYKIVETGASLPCQKPIVDASGKCRVCGFQDMDHGWLYYTTFEGKTFHRRESLWKYKYRFGIEWEAKPLYKNVATGASITGYARTALLRAIHAVGEEHIIYCDTDSLVVDRFADTQILPQSDKLGDWDIEIKNAQIGHFCGKKLYGITVNPSKPCGCETRNGKCDRHKVVSKGARLTFKEIEALVVGGEVIYEPQSPSYSIKNGIDFVDRTLRATGK